jgi:hypothetical protein
MNSTSFLLARGGGGALLGVAIFLCLVVLVWYVCSWLIFPKENWRQLAPKTRETIIESVVGILIIAGILFVYWFIEGVGKK